MSRSHRLAALALGAALAAAACGGGATPTPAPTPTAMPTLVPTPTPVDVGAAFLEQMQATTAGRLPVSGSATFAGIEAAISGRLESSGADDSASTLTIDVAGSPQTSEAIRIGTQKWRRENGGVWVLDPSPADGTKSLSAYLKTLKTLQDKGVETKDGRQLHHLVPPSGAELTPEAMGLNPSIKDPVIGVDFWAEEDGTPAVMSINVAWSQPSGTTTMPIEMAIAVDLTGLGTAATIAAPQDAWTGFTSSRFGYSMAHPADWTVEESERGDQFLLDGTPYVTVMAPRALTGYTLEKLRTETLAANKKELGVKPETDEAITLGGAPARWLTYHFTTPGKVKAYLVDAIAMHGDKAWDIFFREQAGSEEGDTPLFQTMLSTFAFQG